ncbi:MAG TPA: toxin-antitoxin system YwqK family antitoxin, partial [Gammaproteobacteria bacterium]|nr:toxin-antitoxin system YwqK family antitoxin [Gammaproteobacteria bacterium]
MKKLKFNFLVIISFLFMAPVNGWEWGFGHDPMDCDETSPDQSDAPDRYSLDSDGHPLKNGSSYAFSSGQIAGEIWNIAIAQGLGVNGANSACYRAMTTRARNGADDYYLCDKLVANISRNQTILNSMRNDKTYSHKSTKKADGYYEICYGGGSTSERYTYKNNQKDGLYESYHNNGQLAKKADYEDGYIEGTVESYYENGQLKSNKTYENRKENGLFESYYKNGQLKAKVTFLDGQMDGPAEKYYENGQLKAKVTHKEGKEEGPGEIYYENGQLQKKGTLKEDKEDGVIISYYEN